MNWTHLSVFPPVGGQAPPTSGRAGGVPGHRAGIGREPGSPAAASVDASSPSGRRTERQYAPPQMIAKPGGRGGWGLDTSKKCYM